MILGLDTFDNMFFETNVPHGDYYSVKMYGGMMDDLLIEGDLSVGIDTEITTWQHSTILHAPFTNTLKAGNIETGGYNISSVRFQRKNKDSSIWLDFADLPYTVDVDNFYELDDLCVQNHNTYEYSLIPVAGNITGERVYSDLIRAEFDGSFLFDKNKSYKLLYDVEYGNIEHNNPSHTFETMGSRYPVVAYSELDYATLSLTATFISSTTENNYGEVDVKIEKDERDRLLSFIKNKKPKIYKDANGQFRVIAVIDNPTEMPFAFVNGISKLSFNMVEVASNDLATLKAYDLI